MPYLRKHVYKLLPLNQIEPDPNRFNYPEPEEERKFLLESINVHGIFYPIAVCKIEEDKYRIIDGQRRLECACELGYKAVPCTVHPRLNREETDDLHRMLHYTISPLAERFALRHGLDTKDKGR